LYINVRVYVKASHFTERGLIGFKSGPADQGLNLQNFLRTFVKSSYTLHIFVRTDFAVISLPKIAVNEIYTYYGTI